MTNLVEVMILLVCAIVCGVGTGLLIADAKDTMVYYKGYTDALKKIENEMWTWTWTETK